MVLNWTTKIQQLSAVDCRPTTFHQHANHCSPHCHRVKGSEPLAPEVAERKEDGKKMFWKMKLAKQREGKGLA